MKEKLKFRRRKDQEKINKIRHKKTTGEGGFFERSKILQRLVTSKICTVHHSSWCSCTSRCKCDSRIDSHKF